MSRSGRGQPDPGFVLSLQPHPAAGGDPWDLMVSRRTQPAGGSPNPGLKKKLLRATKRWLNGIFGDPGWGETSSWDNAEKGVKDPPPILQKLNILISVICAIIVIMIVLTVLQRIQRSSLYSHAEPCPEDWMYYQRHCYYFSETEADWESSKSFCISHGAYLLLINNKQEMNFITTQMWMPSVWIGLHKTEKEILWLNGSVFDNQLFDIHGKGECVYIQSKVATFSSCTIPKSSVCRKEPYQREDNFS